MERHIALYNIPAFAGFIVVDIVPPVRVVQVIHGGRAKQEFNLVARHADFELFNKPGVDAIALGNIHSVHAARECYNEESNNKN